MLSLFAVGSFQRGMEVVDVSVATAPVRLGATYTPLVNGIDDYPADALALVGGYVLLASGSGVYPSYSPGSVLTYPEACSVVPNPFTGSAAIRYSLPAPSAARIGIFDVGGRRVRDLVAGEVPRAGRVLWDGTDANGRSVAPGVYFVQLRVGTETRTVRTVRLR